MGRYILRRLVQTFPTLLGVILLTFILFHVVGGSPAARILGEHVSAQTLEEFDEQRGFNKPLFFGAWTRTRASEDYRLDRPQARFPFRRLDGTKRSREAFLSSGLYSLNLLFPLPSAPLYRIDLRLDLSAGTQVQWIGGEEAGAPETMEETAGMEEASFGETRSSRFGTTWQEPCVFDPSGAPPRLLISGGSARVRSYRLRRKTDHWLDSQFVHYLRQLARFDLGYSRVENRRVSAILKEGIGPSLALTTPILFGGMALALLLSLWCALFRGRWPDRLMVAGSVVLMSVNYVVWIILGQYLFGFRLGWFPVWGFESWRYLLLPVAIGIVSSLGADVRFFRTVMVEEINREYVQAARARGLSRTRLLLAHVLPNALIPVLAQTAASLPFLYTGSLLLESFFGIPGLGYVGVNALNSADVDVVRAVVLVGSILFMGVNLLADFAYAAVDSRIRLQ